MLLGVFCLRHCKVFKNISHCLVIRRIRNHPLRQTLLVVHVGIGVVLPLCLSDEQAVAQKVLEQNHKNLRTSPCGRQNQLPDVCLEVWKVS